MGKKRLTSTPGDVHFSKYAIGAYGRDAWVCALAYMDRFHTFIDVGAHIGHFTYNALHRFKRVYAIEPVALNFHCLGENVNRRLGELKRRPTVHLIRATCGDELREKATTWFVDPSAGDNSGAWEVSFEPKEGASTTEIDMLTIDSLNLENVSLIKIDTQGWESKILAGARLTLDRCKPVLIVEVAANTNLNNALIEEVGSYSYNAKAIVQKNGIFIHAKRAT